MIVFPHIDQLHQVAKTAAAFKFSGTMEAGVGKMLYSLKTKLDGSNCGVTITPEGHEFQSRNIVLTVDEDYKGFAKFISERLIDDSSDDDRVTFFGEWLGPSIKTSTIAKDLPQQIWVIFAVYDHETQLYHTGPAYIENLARLYFNLDRMYVMPWLKENIRISLPVTSESELEELKTLLAQCEKEDPFLASLGLSGTGEGFVAYPHSYSYLEEDSWRYAFKVKGEAHAVSKAKVSSAPTQVAGVDEFIAFSCPLPRLEQGKTVIGAEKKLTGKFIEWILSDIERECSSELETSGLKMSDVKAKLSQYARDWYLKNV